MTTDKKGEKGSGERIELAKSPDEIFGYSPPPRPKPKPEPERPEQQERQ